MARDYVGEHLKKLVGGKITGVVRDGKIGDRETTYGLAVELPDGKKKDVWIQQDPEGNGPGHLDISDA
jgi:hypothetical protein